MARAPGTGSEPIARTKHPVGSQPARVSDRVLGYRENATSCEKAVPPVFLLRHGRAGQPFAPSRFVGGSGLVTAFDEGDEGPRWG